MTVIVFKEIIPIKGKLHSCTIKQDKSNSVQLYIISV